MGMLGRINPAMELLELVTEYAAVKDAKAWDGLVPGEPARTLDDIAEDYGRALREFLS